MNQSAEETILDRIEKLLRLAADRAATPAEAETAAAMASKLMLKHQIDEARVRVRNKTQAVAADFAREYITITKSQIWEKELLSWIAHVSEVTMYQEGKWTFEVIGTKDNVDFVKTLFVWLRDELHRAAKAAYKTTAPLDDLNNYRKTPQLHMDPYRFHTSFKRGAVTAVGDRLREQKREQQQTARAEAEGSAALVVIDDLKKRALVHFYPHLRRHYFPTEEEQEQDRQQIARWRAAEEAERKSGKKPRKARVSRGRAEKSYNANPEAYYAGRVAGKVVRIRPGQDLGK